jgi:Icc protein
MAQSNTKRPVVLLQITDTHLHATADSRMRGIKTYETLLSVLDHVCSDARWPPDAIVVTGDIVQDESRAGYERFRETMKPFDIPVFCLPGNHDDPQLMAEVLSGHPFQVCGDATIAGWTLVFLNTFARGDDGGRLGVAALNALDQTLAACPDHHALICMHHQPLPMGSAWLDGVGLRDAESFLACITRHDHLRGVLWGHVHQASDRDRDGVRFLSTPSTCSQFRPNSEFFALDSQPPGLRWLTLEPDGRIETVVDWLQGADQP